MIIPIGVIGKIIEGDEAGFFVKIICDEENTGGFLILTSPDEKFSQCFDGWVETEAGLRSYFEESNWRIVWNA